MASSSGHLHTANATRCISSLKLSASTIAFASFNRMDNAPWYIPSNSSSHNVSIIWVYISNLGAHFDPANSCTFKKSDDNTTPWVIISRKNKMVYDNLYRPSNNKYVLKKTYNVALPAHQKALLTIDCLGHFPGLGLDAPSCEILIVPLYFTLLLLCPSLNHWKYIHVFVFSYSHVNKSHITYIIAFISLYFFQTIQ